MKLAEKIVIALLLVVLVIVVLGIALSETVLLYIAFGLMMAISATYTVLQVCAYFKLLETDKAKETKNQLIVMIVSFVVTLAVVVVSILVYTGKINVG